ncbi:MAG: Arc family DNA-binding protein [Oscillospiraceae bacterium]|nr:Arc family DNA-binding protein [Oscillospiraceae bacterium]
MAGKNEYKNNWIAEKLDRINLTVPKGQKDHIKAHAEAHGESVNAFINRAIDETMERDSIKAIPNDTSRLIIQQDNSNSRRSTRAMIESTVRELYSDTTLEYTIDFLIESIQLDGENYTGLLSRTMMEREALITEENKPKIINAIDGIVSSIETIKETVENGVK